MNTFFKLITWLGIVMFILGTIISFYSSWELLAAEPGEIGVDFGHWFAIILGIPGIVFMIIGGILSKPDKFWLVSIIAGLFYIASFFEIYLYFPFRIRDGQIETLIGEILISIIPGLAAIIEGVWLKRTAMRPISKPTFDGIV